MPRTDYDAENVMRQLEQRLKTIGSVVKIHYAQACIDLLARDTSG
jgi:hypothetical protein